MTRIAPCLLAALVALVALGTAPAWGRRRAPAPPPPPAAPGPADWRTPDPRNVLVIDTTKGRIFVELAPAVAPQAVARVRQLARQGVYNGRAFFRVIDGFMDQTGDPQDTGMGGSALPDLPAEFTFRRTAATPLTVIDKEDGLEGGFIGSLPVISQTLDLAVLTADHSVNAWGTFCQGVAGMARSDDPASANSQFFLMRAPTPSLDQKYTPFGRVIGPLEAVLAIKTGEPVPPPQDRMLKVQVLADMPAASRPSVQVIDPAGPWLRAAAAAAKTKKVVGFSLCDIDLPARIQ